MGNVIVKYRILPDSPDNFELLKAELLKLKPDKLEEEPIGFGLKALHFIKVVEDKPRAEDDLEIEVQKCPHMESMETISVTRSF